MDATYTSVIPAIETAEPAAKQPEPTDARAERRSSDPVVSAYIRDISKAALLSAEEELLLFSALAESRAMAVETLFPVEHHLGEPDRKSLHADTLRYEEVDGAWRALPATGLEALGREGSVRVQRALTSWAAARDRIVRANLRLVVYVAKRYHDADMFMDLIQEGNLGLIRAVDRYDPARSARFGPYAAMWILQAVGRGRSKMKHAIHVPAYRRQQLRRFENRCRTETDSSSEDIARAMGTSVDELERLEALDVGPVSLDFLGAEEADAQIVEGMTSLPDGPDELALAAEDREGMQRALDTLPEREARILRWRYGVGTEMQTVREIATRLDLSCERVRQLTQRAMGRLRESELAGQLVRV
ncbi:hypothetical protein CMK11_07800 [Candidatus Poribacteria bacterium]|nr:hypothetical protein [Candidatus Poribacteria bacterium]